MGGDSHVRQKRFSFPMLWSQNLCPPAEAAKEEKLGVRDGLLGVVRVWEEENKR